MNRLPTNANCRPHRKMSTWQVPREMLKFSNHYFSDKSVVKWDQKADVVIINTGFYIRADIFPTYSSSKEEEVPRAVRDSPRGTGDCSSVDPPRKKLRARGPDSNPITHLGRGNTPGLCNTWTPRRTSALGSK